MRGRANRGSFSEVERKAIEVFARHVPKYPASFEADTRLSQDLGADSLDLVELLFELEQVLGCQIPAADASKLTTIIDHVRMPRESRDALEDLRKERLVSRHRGQGEPGFQVSIACRFQ
jgi:acyl carrier protein